MPSLRESVIKLANEKPELRKHLVPLLQKTALENDWTKAEWDSYKEKYPGTKITPRIVSDAEKDKQKKEKEKIDERQKQNYKDNPNYDPNRGVEKQDVEDDSEEGGKDE